MQTYLMLLAVFLGSACLAPAGSQEAIRSQRCVSDLDEVLRRQGAANTSTFFPQGEAEAQQRRHSGICAEDALALAVQILLADDGPESLRDVSRSVGDENCGPHCYLNRSSSLLGLVADRSSRLESQFLPLPPRTDSVASDWVFYLTVPDLDAHGYWALIPRQGGAPRTHGCN